MIIYYSATGNSKHVADRISQEYNMESFDLCSIKDKCIDAKNEDLYFVTFNCFWGISDTVVQFIGQCHFINLSNIFFIVTCGGYLGGADRQIEEICHKNSLPFPKIYDLVMVTNYSILHPTPSKELQRKKLDRAEEKLNKILEGNQKPYKSPALIRFLQKYIHRKYNKYQATRPFHVSDQCISCAKCQNNCPVEAIEMEKGKPKWVKKSCDNCLRCLHNCPSHAINYGENTMGRLQYRYFD